MNPFVLDNKKILITGASSGIGRQSAVSIAEMGGSVILSARREQHLKTLLKSLPGKGHSFLPADLTNEKDLFQLTEDVPELDGIVHSAGIVKPFPVKFIGTKQMREMFSINYDAPVLLTSKLFKLKKIRPAASIVFMSSISSKFPHKGGALYAASKAGLNAFSKVIALEYAPKKIRSNVISAAMVKTPLFEDAEKAITKELMDKHGEQYPLGFGDPEDVANTIVFLLSNASKWITGTEIVMDGGLTAGR